MEMIRLKIVYDALLQKTKTSLYSKDTERENFKIKHQTNKIYFVICNSCYWCASYFSIDNVELSSQVLRCHVCNSRNTELIPISSNDSFRMKYNITRGMELEFYRSDDIVGRQESPEQQIVPPI